VLVLLCVAAGCRSAGTARDQDPVGDPVGASGPTVVMGDWDDLSAAVQRAGPSTQTAVLSESRTGAGLAGSVYQATLLSIDEQTAQVHATLSGDWQREGPPVSIELAVTFGVPDDPARAGALRRRIARELSSLAGRRIAPE
jgi:hypothetical protein